MKPKSSNRLCNFSKPHDFFQPKLSSCYDFKNFSEALDAVKGTASTEGDGQKDNLCTVYDFADVSNALAAAENEDKEANLTRVKAIINATDRFLKVKKNRVDKMKQIRGVAVGAAERRHSYKLEDVSCILGCFSE